MDTTVRDLRRVTVTVSHGDIEGLLHAAYALPDAEKLKLWSVIHRPDGMWNIEFGLETLKTASETSALDNRTGQGVEHGQCEHRDLVADSVAETRSPEATFPL